MRSKQAGFTLVEIAIVLVIVGLLLGGILKGQEMIIQAKVKNSITDFSGVSAAFFGYHLQGREDYARYFSEDFVAQFDDLAWGMYNK